MNRFFEAFFLGVLLLAPTGAWAQASVAQPLHVIVLGTGLTLNSALRPAQTFGGQLQAKLRAGGFEAEVATVADPAQTTATALNTVSAIAGKAPDLVIVELGETDVKRVIDAEMIRENLHKVVFTLRNKGIYVVVMGTKAPASLGERYNRILNGAYDDLKSFMPVYPDVLAGVAGRQDMTLADGYYPNQRGVELMVNGIYPAVDAGLRWKMQVLGQRQAIENTPAFIEPPPAH